MQTTARQVGEVTCHITYEKATSPLHIALTPAESREPAFGALAYAIPGSTKETVHLTILVPSESYNEPAQQVAKVLASKFKRPVFVNMSANGNMLLYSEVVKVVSELVEVS